MPLYAPANTQPGASDLVHIHNKFSKAHIKETQASHPLHARGLRQVLTLRVSDDTLSATPTKNGSGLLFQLAIRKVDKTSSHRVIKIHNLFFSSPFPIINKVSLVGVLKNVFYVAARTPHDDVFHCHAFQVRSGRVGAENLARLVAARSELLSVPCTMVDTGLNSTLNERHQYPKVFPTDFLFGDSTATEQGGEEDCVTSTFLRDSMSTSTASSGQLDSSAATIDSTPGLLARSPTRRESRPVSAWSSVSSFGSSASHPLVDSAAAAAAAVAATVAAAVSRGGDDDDDGSDMDACRRVCQLCMMPDVGESWTHLRLCEHMFHSHCLACWRSDGNNLCPTCAQPVSLSLLTASYLGRRHIASTPDHQPTLAQVREAADMLSSRRPVAVRVKANSSHFKLENVGKHVLLYDKHETPTIERIDRLDALRVAVTLADYGTALTIDRLALPEDTEVDDDQFDIDSLVLRSTVLVFRLPAACEADHFLNTLRRAISSDQHLLPGIVRTADDQ